MIEDVFPIGQGIFLHVKQLNIPIFVPFFLVACAVEKGSKKDLSPPPLLAPTSPDSGESPPYSLYIKHAHGLHLNLKQ